jgi:protein TonB
MEGFRRYQAGELAGRDKARADEHIKSCDLCREALEGFALVKDPDRVAAMVDEINRNLSEKLRKKRQPPRRLTNRVVYYSVAASIVIFIGVFSYLKFFSAQRKPELAQAVEKTLPPVTVRPGEVQEEDRSGQGSSPEEEVIRDEETAKETESHAEAPAPAETVTNRPVIEGIARGTGDGNAQSIEQVIGGMNIEPSPVNVLGDTMEVLAHDDLSTRQNKTEEEVQGQDYPIGQYNTQEKQRAAAGKAVPAEQKTADNIFLTVEQMPEFPGGEKALMKYLSANLSYPPGGRDSLVEGTVYVSFIVEKDGSVSHVRVARGLGRGFDEEVVRVIEKMPRWTPGQQRRKPVRVQFNLPVVFKMN